MQNSMVVFNFPVLDRKYLIWENLVHKIRNVSSSLDLIPRINRICRTQWWCSLWPETLFLGKIGLENPSCLFEVKLDTKTNSNIQNSIVVFTFSVFDRKYPFWANLVKKVKIFSLSWNLVASLNGIGRIHWCCSLFPFSTGNNFFGQSWSKKSKFSVWGETWYLD